MHKKRIAWFLIMIAAGVGLGLVYGWIINPVESVDITADTLRADYKTDYLLMVAEIYKSEGSLDLAARRLELIDSRAPQEITSDGLTYARVLGYSPSDLSLIEILNQAFQTSSVNGPGETDEP